MIYTVAVVIIIAVTWYLSRKTMRDLQKGILRLLNNYETESKKLEQRLEAETRRITQDFHTEVQKTMRDYETAVRKKHEEESKR